MTNNQSKQSNQSTERIRYKLTDANMQTHNGFQWQLGEWREATGEGEKPCSDAVLHHYSNPLLAVLFNPIHAAVRNPRLFRIEIDEEINDDGKKGWCKKQRLVEELPLPVIPAECRVAFAIYAAAQSPQSAAWMQWATNWMRGINRTADAADEAAAYAANADRAALRAANAAAYAAGAADAAVYATRAVYAAAYTADAAIDAAVYATANAYAYAADADAVKIDFSSIITHVMQCWEQQQ